MDVEGTIEFLLSNQAKHEERLTRLETVVGSLAGSVNSLTGSVEKLAANPERLDGAMVMLAESGVQTNRRIDTLISATGAMVRQQPPQPSMG